jgi:hypothetical protein
MVGSLNVNTVKSNEAIQVVNSRINSSRGFVRFIGGVDKPHVQGPVTVGPVSEAAASPFEAASESQQQQHLSDACSTSQQPQPLHIPFASHTVSEHGRENANADIG